MGVGGIQFGRQGYCPWHCGVKVREFHSLRISLRGNRGLRPALANGFIAGLGVVAHHLTPDLPFQKSESTAETEPDYHARNLRLTPRLHLYQSLRNDEFNYG